MNVMPIYTTVMLMQLVLIHTDPMYVVATVDILVMASHVLMLTNVMTAYTTVMIMQIVLI